MEFLASLGAMLGVNEASKLLDDLFIKDERNLSRIIRAIITAATNKGSQELSKVQRAIENIPLISGSSHVQEALREARRKTNDTLSRVETKVNELQGDATQLESELARQEGKGFISKLGDKFRSNGPAVKQSAMNFANRYGIDYNAVENKVKEENK